MDESRSILSLRVVLVCVVGSALAGCGSPKSHVSGAAVPAAGIVYESQGEIAAVRVASAKGREQVFIWEWIGSDDALWAGPDVRGDVRRLLLVDLVTGETKSLAEEPCRAFPLMESDVAVSTEGRWASVESGGPAGPIKSRMLVGDCGGRPTAVTPWGEGLRALPRWSPDGTALLYVSVKYDEFPKIGSVEAVAIAVPGWAGSAYGEIVLTRPGYSCTGLDWAPDGRRIYVASRSPDGEDHLLEAVTWPGLARETLVRFGHLAQVSVARDTGDVIYMEVREEQPGEPGDVEPVVVWRLRPDGRREETAVRLERSPLAAIVSPDGERLAILTNAEDSCPEVPKAEALAVYDLATGTSQRINGHQTALLMSVHWVYGGRALVFPEGKNTVRLAAIEP